QRQGLGADIAELDLRLGILAGAAQADDGTVAESGMPRALPDTILPIAHRDAAGNATRRAGSDDAGRPAPEGVATAAPGARLAKSRMGMGNAGARSEPFQVLLGDFVQEPRTHGVARLAMQHAALRQAQ